MPRPRTLHDGKPPKTALSPEDRQMHVRLALLSLAVMINVLGFSLIIPLVPEYVQRGLHTVPTDPRLGEYGGWLTAVYALMQFGFAPLWGALSDRVGRKPILIGSLVGDAVFYTLFGLSTHSLAGQFAARILAGIFSSATLSVAQAYAADITPPHLRAMGFGYLGAAFGVGFVFGPALGGVVGHFSLALPLFLAAAFALGNAAYIALLLPEPLPFGQARPPSPKRRGEGAEGSTSPPSSALGEVARNKPEGVLAPPTGRFGTMAQALTGPLGFLYLLTFAVTFAFANLEGTFTAYLKQHFLERHPVETAGGVFVYIGLLIVLVQGGARALVKRYGETRLVVTGIGLMALGFLTFPFAHPLPLLLLGPLLPISLGSGLNAPSLRALISKRATAQGAALGLSASFDSLARATGPAVGGWLYKNHGQAAPYWCAGVVMALSFMFALWRRQDMEVSAS